MKKIILSLSILIGVIITAYGLTSSQRNYTHKLPEVNSEFDNLYVITAPGDRRIPLGNKLYFGDDLDFSIQASTESPAAMRFMVDDVIVFDLTATSASFKGDLKIPEAQKLYLGDDYFTNSTGDSIEVYTDGSISFTIHSSSVIIPSLTKFFVDDGSNTYHVQSADDVWNFYTGGAEAFRLDATNVRFIRDVVAHENFILTANKKFFLDSGGDTYFQEHIAGDLVDMVIGAATYRFTPTAILPETGGTKDLGTSTDNDWNVIYYHTLSQHSTKRDKQNIAEVSTNTLRADLLPSPKTYERRTSTGVTEYNLIAEDCPPEVTFSEHGKVAGIKTNSLIAYICGVVKEQDKSIIELKQQIIELQSK